MSVMTKTTPTPTPAAADVRAACQARPARPAGKWAGRLLAAIALAAMALAAGGVLRLIDSLWFA